MTCHSGCASFVNGVPQGGGNGPFNHEYCGQPEWEVTDPHINRGRLEWDGISTREEPGWRLSDDYYLPLPEVANANRPFTLNYNGRYPPEWENDIYESRRVQTSILHTASGTTNYFKPELYYESDYLRYWYDACSGVRLMRASNPELGIAYLAMNGVSAQTQFGAGLLAKFALLNMVRAFHAAGHPKLAENPNAYENRRGRIPQLPRVEIIEPLFCSEFEDLREATIKWSRKWKRGDGRKYIETYPDNFTPAALPENQRYTIYYCLKYKPILSAQEGGAEGAKWRFLKNNGSDGDYTELGVPPTDAQNDCKIEDVGGNPEDEISVIWDLSRFASGRYLLCLECYQNRGPGDATGRKLHYSYHKTIFIVKKKG
jgi:hypothetical protein